MHHFAPFAGPISLLAAFMAGAAGSVHCLVMCGGISGALGMRGRRGGAAAAIGQAVTYQIGRIASYSIAGALAGALGGALLAAIDVEWAGIASRLFVGLVLVLAAVGILSRWRPLAGVEVLGAGLWRRLAPVARGAATTGLRGALLLGAIWGWLPCGLVYSMLLVAALAGSPLMGASTMVCFGLGTAPAVLAAGLLSGPVWRVAAARGLNVAAGSLLLVFGILTMLGPFGFHSHS
jgi:sulfite exporter TauE/SafE